MPWLYSPKIPTNIIVQWSGTVATIPTGWVLCDSTNGTPNLIETFIRGISTNSTDPGNTGGANNVTLLTDDIPAHSHTVNQSAHTHTSNVNTGTQNAGSAVSLTASTATNGDASSGQSTNSTSVNPTIANTGTGLAHSNEPVYFELAYIMKL